MKLSWRQIAEAVSAPFAADERMVSGWSVDTRTLAPGDLYFALRGPNHDGHDYLSAAMERGAAGVVVETGRAGGISPALEVDNPLRALQRLAAEARREWGGTVIGVTGSAGKTTTKDAIAHLLAAGKTEGNLNNHVGVPLSILRLPEACRAAVLEMGMNHAGEIRALCEIAAPDIGVVTNAGYAHVENFDSIEDVARAKRELIQALPRGGTAVLNADDPRVAKFGDAHAGRSITFGFSPGADVRATEMVPGGEWVRFCVDRVPFKTQLVGRHGVMNVLAALAVARVFAVPFETLRRAVSAFTLPKMRGERLVRDGVTIWNDCYNSNPEAARSMIDVLASATARRRVAVLGEMLELGRSAEPLHRDVGKYVAERGIDLLIGIRGAARHMVDEAVLAGMSGGAAYFFEDPATAGEFLRGLIREGDALLFKGSRGVKVELALEKFLGSHAAETVRS
ncbi:MAG: UDP-N-acetylmuramoyl-tripeptide--D-alanyl-D-alanine ligase [Bryobacteraceae bacterium]